jgi:hypothetical protein
MKVFVRRSPMLVKRFLKTAPPARAVVGYVFATSIDSNPPNWGEVNGELHITVDGREPYPLTGIFNGDKKLAPFVLPGSEIPVRVDPEHPNKVAIDWNAWSEQAGTETGDRDAIAQANQEAFQAAKAGDASTDPADREEAPVDPSQPEGEFLASWEEQILAGLDEARKRGKLSEEEYQQARRDAGL